MRCCCETFVRVLHTHTEPRTRLNNKYGIFLPNAYGACCEIRRLNVFICSNPLHSSNDYAKRHTHTVSRSLQYQSSASLIAERFVFYTASWFYVTVSMDSFAVSLFIGVQFFTFFFWWFQTYFLSFSPISCRRLNCADTRHFRRN